MSDVIPHWLSKQASLAPNQIAIETEKGESITFLSLEQESKRFAKRLATLGIEKGSHVGILSANGIPMVIAIHALSYLGAVGVLLNTRLTNKELTYQMKDAEISLLLTCDKHITNGKEIMPHIYVRSFAEIEQLQEKQVILNSEIHVNDMFTIIYTSGTTGFPKGVIHTYGNHWASAIGSVLNLGLDKNDKWLAALPIFHVGGLSIFIRSVIYGIPVLLLEKFDEETVNKAIIKQGVTIVSVVTVMLQRLMKALGSKEYPAAFRCMLLGGGPAPRPLLERAKKHNIPVVQSYGMTETSSQIVTLSEHDALAKIGSAGKPLFTAQLHIHHPDHQSIGEIYVKGPMVSAGYFNNKKATGESFKAGWLATGDLGYVDKDGFLYVVDRRTDLIISGGENVYPAEVEAALLGMNEIAEVGIVGVEDGTWGQVPVAFVVKDREPISEAEIIHYAQEKLARYKVPKQVHFVSYLPRNASNKLVRRELLKWI